MYTLGVVLTVVGGIGIIGTIIWIVLDNNKKNKQRDKIIENLRQQQYKQNINRQEPTNQQTNKNTNHGINQEINSLPTENLIQESTNQETLSYTELDNKIDDTDENNIEEICPNCKNPIKKGIKFCGNCGQKLL